MNDKDIVNDIFALNSVRPHFLADQHLDKIKISLVPVWSYIMLTSSCNVDPFTPHFYIVNLGFTGVYIVFLIFDLKQKLRVLVRTASLRQFLPVPTIDVLSNNKKISPFSCENYHFYSRENHSILHRHVCEIVFLGGTSVVVFGLHSIDISLCICILFYVRLRKQDCHLWGGATHSVNNRLSLFYEFCIF